MIPPCEALRARFKRWDLSKLLDDPCRVNTTHSTVPINLLLILITDTFHRSPGIDQYYYDWPYVLWSMPHGPWFSGCHLNTNLLQGFCRLGADLFLKGLLCVVRTLFITPMPIHNGTIEVVLILPFGRYEILSHCIRE